jgi:hypothetical protein
VKITGDTIDLTSRFNALREVLHNEIIASAALLGSRVDGVDAQREVLLVGINARSQGLQDQIDRRLDHFQLQVDQRFDSGTETLVALKEMLNERYATQTKALDAAFKAAEQAVAVALANAEKATAKAEAAADKRFDGVNEFRKTLSDQTTTFLPRAEYAASSSALSDRVTMNAERVSALELRLTSRLDRGDGIDAGSAATVAGRRADAKYEQSVQSDRATQLRATLGIVIAAFSAVVATAAIIVLVVKG